MTTTTYNPGKRPAILDVAGLEFGPRCTCCGTPEEASIRGFGNLKAKLMEVGIAPGRQEMQWGAPLVGPSGKRNDLCLQAVKIERKRVYATNLCCFWEDAPSEAEVAACWPRLREEILTVRPKLMLSLGGLATSWLTGYPVGKIRGDLIRPEHNRSPHFAELRDLWGEGSPLPTILPTWHPAATLRIPSLTTDVLRDFWKIKPFLKGRLEPLRWTHEVVTSRKAAQTVLDGLAASPGLPVALDVETERDEANAFQRIVCVALAVPERLDLLGGGGRLPSEAEGSLASASEADLETLCGHPEQTYRAWVFPVEVLRGLRWPHHVRWLEHNMQFDNPAIWRTFGVWLPVWRDTMLDSWARDERPGRDEDSQSERSRSGEASKPKGPGFHNLKQLSAEYCLDGDTKVLCADLLWRRIADIVEGNEVVGFDEHIVVPADAKKNYKVRRKMSTAVVQRKLLLFAERLRITTDVGEIIATPDHKWIAITPHTHCGTGHNQKNKMGGVTMKFQWRESKTLQPGDIIARLCDPWEEDTSGDAMYLRGFMDGEGTLSCTSHEMAAFSQNDGPVAENACEIIKKLGFNLVRRRHKHRRKCGDYEITGHRSAMKFVGRIRPIRFLANPNLRNLWEGKSLYGKGTRHATVLSVEKMTDGEVVALTTSTGTFIAEGLLSHNCGSQPGYGDEMKKFFKAGTIGEADQEALHRYNAFDAVNTVALPGRLPRRPCGALMSLIMPAARAYARIHLTGIPVDLDRAKHLQSEWEPWITELEADLQGTAFDLGFRNPPKLKRDIAAKAAFEEQWGEGSWMGEPINLGSNPQLATLLYGILGLPITVRSKKTAKPSVGKEAIASIDHPFVEKLEELRTAKHVKASHLDPVVNLTRGEGEAHRARVHASIWVNGAVNYRRSITNPPMQQFPQEHPKPFWKRLAEVRSIIAPDPGFVLIEADYKQIELHGCARLSGDPVFLADLGTGDYHTKIVRDVFHVGADPSSVVFSHTRRLAKVFNFAVIYKVEENTLARTMNQALRDAGTGGPPVTPAAAGRLIRQWYARNRRVWEWHRELIAEVRRTGKLVNAFEEVRRFPLYDASLDKQIVNWPVSSTCGAHSEISLIELEPIIRKDFGGSILFDTHDSLMFHVPAARAVAAAKVIKEVMEKPKIPGWAPLEVEFKASSTSWREMHEWKNLEEIPEWMVQRPRLARKPSSRQLAPSRR